MQDLGFLCDLYASFRAHELSCVPWTSSEKAAFLTDQFILQHEQFVRRFPNGAFWVVEAEGRPVGRLYLNLADDGLLIVDIGLRPETRRLGVGRRLLEWAEAQALNTGAPRLWLHVAPWNGAALALYQAAGLRLVESAQTLLTMEKRLRDPAS
ncbi:MAG: GNAT family N-acetyltransferase [Alphaproteobacteria bacterium]|nr:GNAT family N-acetyltransferase [Alphaproteobacteria bacterium]